MSRRRNLLLKRNGNGIPRAGLLAYFRESGGELVDTIGESAITFTDGSAADFENSTFQFDYNATMAGVDTNLGGGVLFTSTTPIARTFADWVSLAAINSDYLWIGYHGIAAYSADLSAEYDRIIMVLLLPSVMLDTLEMLDTLRMVA